MFSHEDTSRQQEMGEKTFSQTQGLPQEQLGDGWWLGMVIGGWGQ